jgi:hypothetical protein
MIREVVNDEKDEQLCDHHERSSVRIDCIPLFHEFKDCGRSAEEDETLAKEMEIYNVA